MYLYNIFARWYSLEGELQVESLKLFTPDPELDSRKATRIIRKWYKRRINRSIPKYYIRHLYRNRCLLSENATQADINRFNKVTNDTIKELTEQDKTQGLTADTQATPSVTR